MIPKGEIRSRNSKRVKKYNGQKKKDKKTYNDLQNTTHITKDAAIRTPLKTGDELKCTRRVSSSCSMCDTRRVTLVTNTYGKSKVVYLY